MKIARQKLCVTVVCCLNLGACSGKSSSDNAPCGAQSGSAGNSAATSSAGGSGLGGAGAASIAGQTGNEPGGGTGNSGAGGTAAVGRAGSAGADWATAGEGGLPGVAGMGQGDAGSAGESGASSCVTPPRGMVAWWPGDGTSKDIVGSADGTAENGAGFAPGMVGQAFSLDGQDDFIDLGNSSALNVSSGDFTVDAWVLFKSQQGDMSIVDKMGGSSVNGDGWRLLKQADDRFWFCFGGGAVNRCVDPAFTVFSTTLVVPNVWFHVAAVKSGIGFALYVDGKQEDARAPLPAFVDTNSTNLRVGSYLLQSANLNGLVDEVELFKRALTGAEIQAIFEAGRAAKCR
jgi:Concanavalin A-like lectin/glucanases superfamily